MVGIYLIKNKANNKVYIGQSIDVDKRIKEHFYKALCEKDVSFSSILHVAIRKYGKEMFDCEVLECCSEDKLDEREKYYIKLYDSITPNGYNISPGGRRNKIHPRKKHYCPDCGKEITRGANRCLECAYKNQRKADYPDREEFKALIREKSFTEIGKMFGISDKAVAKRCVCYGLPFKKREIDSMFDEEWSKI